MTVIGTTSNGTKSKSAESDTRESESNEVSQDLSTVCSRRGLTCVAAGG